MQNPFKNILVIRLGAIGDLVHVTPSLDQVYHSRKDIHIHLLSDSPLAEWLKTNAYQDKAFTVWKLKPYFGVFSLFQKLFQLAAVLRKAPIDSIVNLHPAFKTYLLAALLLPPWQWLSRIRVYKKQKVKAKGKWQRSVRRLHAVENFYQPFQQLLALPEASLEELSPQFSLKETSDSKTLNPHPLQNRALQVALIAGVGTQRQNRAWPTGKWLSLLRYFNIDQHSPQGRWADIAHFHFIGGPDEIPLYQSILAGLPPAIQSLCINHAGKTSLSETIGILQKSDIVIAADTGPLHIAAALERPVVALFGPTSIIRTGARSVRQGKIHHLRPQDSLDCWPCEKPSCPLSGEEHLACMEQIQPETVIQACRNLLEHRTE
ncbi:MAG: glycosyltransferase family 9 protein [Cyanobacteria bacterium]|nr:glycosyltransferase family 9 protein [Cyanobacteriota bacterium]